MSSPKPRTVELASSILEHTTIIETFLQQNGLPSPSFNPGTPPKLPLSPEVERSLETAVAAVDELLALLLGPMGWLLDQIGHSFGLASLHAMYRYKIPSKIPIGSEISINELTKLCSSSDSADGNSADTEDKLTRLIQHAVSNYLLVQKSPGGPVSHSALSAMISQLPALDDWVGAACEDMWPSAPHVVPAIIQNSTNSNGHAIETSPPNGNTTTISDQETPKPPVKAKVKVTGHNLAEGTQDNFFQTLRSQPARMARFGNAMSVMQNMMPGFDASAALEAYDWAGLAQSQSKSQSQSESEEKKKKKLVVVDIGGGQNGSFAHALAEKYGPDLLEEVIFQDLDLDKTQSLTVSTKNGAVVKSMHHDFFTPQPILGADVYFLRMVLHDWSDEACARILRGIIPALTSSSEGKGKVKGRILINDLVVPGPPALPAGDENGGLKIPSPPSRYMERQMRCQDIAMMAMFDSKERNEGQWRALVKLADERFRVTNVTRLVGGMSPLAVIEVVFDSD